MTSPQRRWGQTIRSTGLEEGEKIKLNQPSAALKLSVQPSLRIKVTCLRGRQNGLFMSGAGIGYVAVQKNSQTHRGQQSLRYAATLTLKGEGKQTDSHGIYWSSKPRNITLFPHLFWETFYLTSQRSHDNETRGSAIRGDHGNKRIRTPSPPLAAAASWCMTPCRRLRHGATHNYGVHSV
jgi:hypothetical protein